MTYYKDEINATAGRELCKKAAAGRDGKMRVLASSKAKSEELRKLYNDTRADYLIARREDAMKMENV